jgi:DNA repair protein RadD
MLVPRYYQLEAEEKLWQFFAEHGVNRDGTPQAANPLCLMPTGVGKSIVIAAFAARVIRSYPNQRVMILTHVKELIEQNASKLEALWPGAPYGFYSAGLGQKDHTLPITFGGVASVVKKIELFGRIDLLIVDEAHLVSLNETAMYFKIIDALRAVNPWLRIVGLSATGWRLGQGKLTDDIVIEGVTKPAMFTHVAADYTTPEWFARFIAEGFLMPPIPRRTSTELDLSTVGIRQGEFNATQLAAAVDKHDVTYKALKEALELGYDRNCWLAFCASIEHADHVAEMLQSLGVSAVSVHSKLTGNERDARIAAFKRGEYRCLTNNGIFTTGQDHPPIDLIIGLRPTMSASLHVQMIGRGMRPSPATGKQNCLVLDFAANTRRLGPVDDPVIPKKPGEKGGGEVPVKICENCGCYNHTRVPVCAVCGAPFEFQEKLVARASSDELLKDSQPEVETFDIIRVLYSRHQKSVKDAEGKRTPTGPAMIKVSYFCGLQMFNEYVCLDHTGPVRSKALNWWRVRFPTAWEPKNVDEALTHIAHVRAPKRVKVWVNKKWPEVVGYDFGVM